MTQSKAQCVGLSFGMWPVKDHVGKVRADADLLMSERKEAFGLNQVLFMS
jgi:hypothetical protein